MVRMSLIIDDMVDTRGTLTKAADLMMESGATSVRAYCTHGILSGTAYERLDRFKHCGISNYKYNS